MSTSTRTPQDHGADPWWGDADLSGTPLVIREPVATDPLVAPRARTRTRGRRRRIPVWVRMLVLPIVLVGAAFRRWPRLRRIALRLALVGAVMAVVSGSVGVILLNNVVIRRTAELGKLDEERRELRRDNAVLGANAAKGSSQATVVRRAQRMGMVRSGVAPTYTYLDPASAELTPALRAKRAQIAAARRARAAAAEAAATNQGASK